jgi:hypothetical protein
MEDILVRLMALLWGTALLLVAVLLVGPRVAARIQYNLNLWRRARNQAAISAALAQEAHEKEQELLATDDDLVGCILCRFDLAGHKGHTP